jgi:muramoyltetrapeptide carboxypeptidase
MGEGGMHIGVAAPGSRIEPALADKVKALAATLYGPRAEIHFHPQCFLSSGHFAGDDAARAQAFLDIANDASFGALWFARGGYGACRLAPRVMAGLKPAAKDKIYLGYSDAGSLLAALYTQGFAKLAHGPMAADMTREGGEAPIERALAFLVEGAPETLEPRVSPTAKTAAFNITILSTLIGTPWQPDLTGHVLMLEEVSEYMYRIDRSLFHLTSNPGIRRVAGIRLGRCSAIPANDPDFDQTEEEVIKHWCAESGIPYLGRADIGHDINNRVVPLGRWRGQASLKQPAV